MFARLPISIDPYREAERNSQYSGDLQLAQLKRLRSALAAAEGTVRCEFSLRRDSDRKCWVEGKIETELMLQCQRCLQNYLQPVAASFVLRMVRSNAEAETEDDGYEPLLIEDDCLDIATMIEDEVLLAMPTIPKHEDMTLCHWRSDATEAGTAPERSNPFAVLANLKKH